MTDLSEETHPMTEDSAALRALGERVSALLSALQSETTK